MAKFKKFVIKVYNFADEVSRDLSRSRVATYAASCAFFMFLSLVPIIIVICSLLPYTPISQEEMFSHIALLLPPSMETLIQNIVSDVYSSSVTTLSFSIVAILWSSSKSFIAISRGLNEVYGITKPRNYFLLRLYAVIYTLVLLVTTVATLSVIVFGESLGELANISPSILRFASWFRYIIMFLLLAAVFISLYRFAPNRRSKLSVHLPGAATAALAWIVFSFAFSIYVTHSGKSVTYGSLATIIFAMLWIYCCMYIILIGGYINCRLEKTGWPEKLKKEKI